MSEKPSGLGLVGMIALPLVLVACCAFGPALLAAVVAGSWGSASGFGPLATAAVAIGIGGAVYLLARKRRNKSGSCPIAPPRSVGENPHQEVGARTPPPATMK